VRRDSCCTSKQGVRDGAKGPELFCYSQLWGQSYPILFAGWISVCSDWSVSYEISPGADPNPRFIG
jgi:hypothetical protein